jgi:tetratricopeptide (TPR) repeat protein
MRRLMRLVIYACILIIIIFVIGQKILSVTEISLDDIQKWFQQWWYAISFIILGILGYLENRRRGKIAERERLERIYSFDQFKVLSFEEIVKGVLPKPPEEYLERAELEELVKIKCNVKVMSRPRYLLIYGPPGIGKTREAVEIIRQLEKSEKERNIYFLRGEVKVFPTPRQPQIYRDIILFLDDIRPSFSRRLTGYEEDKLPSFVDLLKRVIGFFERHTELSCVIITALTEEYKELEEGLDPNFLNKFEKIPLKEFSATEAYLYTKKVADELNLNISEPFIKEIAKISGGVARSIRDFLKRKKYQERKTNLNLEDIEEFRRDVKSEWISIYNAFPSKEEKLIYDTLAPLYQFSIPPFVNVVEELWYRRTKGGLRFFATRKFKKLLQKHDGIWLSIERNRIYCPESRLSLKVPGDPSLKEDLEELTSSFRLLRKKRKYENFLYDLFEPLAHELHKHGMYDQAIEFYDYMLDLLRSFPPPNTDPEKKKSDFLFYKGHAYYSLGKKYWDKAGTCYRESIELDELNLFAKHAFATLLWKRSDSTEALKLLNEITDIDEKDLLAYKTKLDIYTDLGDTDSEEAKKTYKEIEDLIKNNSSFSEELIFSTKLALTRFLAKKGEILKEQGKSKEAEDHFNKVVIPKFESLISEIPPELNELKAIVKNAYGCFLYDVLEKIDDGATQLEETHEIFPKHKHTLHKLVTIYIKKGEENPLEKEKYWKKARTYLTELLDIDKKKKYPQALRSKAELDGKDIDWKGRVKSVEQGNLSKLEFWQEVYEIFKEYQDALEEETEYPSLHNGIVHHSAGWFLWNVEMKAKNLIQSKSPLIPSADVEFRKSIEIEQKFKEKDFPREVKKHLLVAYDTLSSYLQMTGRFRKDPNMVKESYFYSNKAIELSKKWKIKFHSENSYNESYIAKLLLDEGEVDEAIERFKRAIAICPNNLMAWFGLEESYEKKGNYQDALKCLENIAKIKNRPDTYGMIRKTAKRWMEEGKIPQDMHLLHSYSKKAYELDPTGALDPRNVSDYAYDNLKIGKIERNEALLKEGKRLYIDLIKQTLCRIDENPDEEFLYTLILRSYCPPIWKSGQKLDNEIKLEIESCAKRHSTNPFANKMAGIVLQRNGECSRALPYLEKAPKDAFVLKSLIECYEALGKREKAEEVAKQFANLLAKKRKLKESILFQP